MSGPTSAMATALRLGLVAVFAAEPLGCAASTLPPPPPPVAMPAPMPVPASLPMEPSVALGLWRTNFGAVKIERDQSREQPEYVQGAWRYVRGEAEIIGVFWGRLEGNVLRFLWHEPAWPQDLEGEGFIVFAGSRTRFDGRWWASAGGLRGTFSGQRAEVAAPSDPNVPPLPLQ